METLMTILRYGSIGGRSAEPVTEREAQPVTEKKNRRRRERDGLYATQEEIQMCLNCTKRRPKGCGDNRFRACIREMQKARSEKMNVTTKKMIYVARDGRNGGDEYEECVSFDLCECRAAAIKAREQLTDRERRGSESCIEGYKVPVLDGMGARVAYEEWCLSRELLPDPEYYETVYIDADYDISTRAYNSNYNIWIRRGDEELLSREMSTDGFLYVVDQERYNEYINEGHEDEGDIINVDDATDADYNEIIEALTQQGVTLSETVKGQLYEHIECVYRCKSI